MSKFFRMRGGVKVPRVKGVGAMVDDGHRHIPHSPPVLLASICNKENSNSQSFQIAEQGGRYNSLKKDSMKIK